jgi:hypothetical protein
MTTDGKVVWEWRSWEHLDPEKDGITAVEDDRDVWPVANSVSEMSDGNILVSFRTNSMVVMINRQTGAIYWKLGAPPLSQWRRFVDRSLCSPVAVQRTKDLQSIAIPILDYRPPAECRPSHGRASGVRAARRGCLPIPQCTKFAQRRISRATRRRGDDFPFKGRTRFRHHLGFAGQPHAASPMSRGSSSLASFGSRREGTGALGDAPRSYGRA